MYKLIYSYLIFIFLLFMFPNISLGQVNIKKDEPFNYNLSADVYLTPGEQITESELRDIVVKYAINNDAPVLWIDLYVGGQTPQGWVIPDYLGSGYVDTSNVLHMAFVNESGGRSFSDILQPFKNQFYQLREMTRKPMGNPLKAPGQNYMQKRQNFLQRQLTR